MPVSLPISQLQLPKKENQFGLNSHKRCSLVRAFGSGSSQVSDLQIDSPWVKCPPLDQSTVMARHVTLINSWTNRRPFKKPHLKVKGWLFQVNLKSVIKNSEYLHLNVPKMEMIRQEKERWEQFSHSKPILQHGFQKAFLLSPSLLCSLHNRPITQRRGVKARNSTTQKAGRLRRWQTNVSR